MNITKLSIERPTLVIVVFTLLLFLGVISYFMLSYELVPKFNPPTIAVTTAYPGASPSEVESDITRPVEDVLSTLSNITRINAISQENFSVVRLELNTAARVDDLLQEAQRKLLLIRDELPAGIEPVISRFDFDDLPILRIGAYSDMSETSFHTFITEKVRPRISQVGGVAEVRIIGGREREISVEVDPRKLDIFGISLLDALHSINTSNIEVPAGRISDSENQFAIRLRGTFHSLKDLEKVSITSRSGVGPVLLRDVAEIRDTYKETKVITRLNGRESLAIEVRKQSDANAVEMSQEVRAVLDDLERGNTNISLDFVIASDSSDFTLKAANAVMLDLGYAVILVSLVMLLFLHSMRNALIVLVAIPTSIISTLLVMLVLGYTLNLMTLLALSLAIGILVDDSIVVLENIYRHLEMGKKKAASAFEGRMEIGFTALSITLVDVVVFLPILFAEGIVADLFEQFSVVMITSTLMSLFVSFTMVPLLASRYSQLEKLNELALAGKIVNRFENFIDRVLAVILGVLKWTLNHKISTLVIALILFSGSISLIIFGFIGLEFTRSGDRNEFIIELELPNDATIERTNRTAFQVEQHLKQIPEIETVFTTVGTTSTGRIESNPGYVAEFQLKLIDKRDRDLTASELARNIKLDLMSNLPDVTIKPVEINLIGLRDDGAVQMTLYGIDMGTLLSISREIESSLDSIPGTVEVSSSVRQSGMEFELTVDRKKSTFLGLDLTMVGRTLRTALNGETAGKFKENGQEYNINLKVSDFFTRSTDHVRQLSVTNNRGQLIPMDQFAELREVSAPNLLERTNRLSSVTISSQVLGRTGRAVGSELEQKLQQMDLPDDISYVFTGQLERLSDGFQTLGIALIASVLFVYLIMVALYDSFVYPFVVLFSIPMAIVGALLLLALTQQTLNIFSIFGLIMLIGLVGKNAILVVDFTNKLRQEGMELMHAILEATKLRFRPVLMTNLSMVIGLLPIALASGAGSEWKNGLALALIGGLSSSMLLSLILVPVVYTIMEKLKPEKKAAPVRVT